MKIKKEHFDYIQTKCQEVLTKYPNMWDKYKALGLTARRFQWDVARTANLIPFFCDTIYKYANDRHIDTVLNEVIPCE